MKTVENCKQSCNIMYFFNNNFETRHLVEFYFQMIVTIILEEAVFFINDNEQLRQLNLK